MCGGKGVRKKGRRPLKARHRGQYEKREQLAQVHYVLPRRSRARGADPECHLKEKEKQRKRKISGTCGEIAGEGKGAGDRRARGKGDRKKKCLYRGIRYGRRTCIAILLYLRGRKAEPLGGTSPLKGKKSWSSEESWGGLHHDGANVIFRRDERAVKREWKRRLGFWEPS